jgi:hypothetical protein
LENTGVLLVVKETVQVADGVNGYIVQSNRSSKIVNGFLRPALGRTDQLENLTVKKVGGSAIEISGMKHEAIWVTPVILSLEAVNDTVVPFAICGRREFENHAAPVGTTLVTAFYNRAIQVSRSIEGEVTAWAEQRAFDKTVQNGFDPLSIRSPRQLEDGAIPVLATVIGGAVQISGRIRKQLSGREGSVGTNDEVMDHLLVYGCGIGCED